MKAITLTHKNGDRTTYKPDPDGLLWSYQTPDGQRWIGWRALLDLIGRNLERGGEQ